jgi:glucose/arabinose dehydrogenase
MRTATLGLLGVLVLAACTSGTTPRPAASARPQASASATPTPAPTPTPPLKPAGALNLTLSTVASGLVAPWAIDFAKDGSAWLTERDGRVRVIRDGQLLPNPALTLSVVSSPGCESGLLGIALHEPNAFLYYTYRGAGGNTNRVSRFTMSGNTLSGEQVVLDGIPGGTCYHFGGRLKLGPDGFLYVTTGEGYVASRAADPSNLSGKILRLHEDGTGREVFAWGFRNPQGIAFDLSGHLYASNNGPTGDLLPCCHDEVDLVQQGAFYGWPAWAAGTRTPYAQGSLPNRTGPMAESGTDTWAPSGMTFFAPSKDEQPTLIVSELRGQALRRFVVDAADPTRVTSQEITLQGQGRLRDAVAGPDGCLYTLTTNRDGRGSPGPSDDRVLKLCPA